MKELVEIIHRHLENAGTSWSIGSFGAIGEFHQDASEKRDLRLTDTGGEIVTDRGALSVRLAEEAKFLPYEQLSRRRSFWLQGSNFILPEETALRPHNDTLRNLGPDKEALRERDRTSVLYDMGLDLPHVSVCIRTDNKELQTLLDENLGRSLFDPENPAMRHIKENHPHRVFISNLGRAEIYQHIGSTEKGVPSPQGPHTHILPKLLKHKRTHAANIHIPAGFLPCLSMYPANPQLDPFGEPREFDPADFERFQDLFQRFGEANLVALKEKLPDLVRSGHQPDKLHLDNRQLRTCARVALRQLAVSGGEDLRARLTPWLLHFEPDVEEAESDHHGH